MLEGIFQPVQLLFTLIYCGGLLFCIAAPIWFGIKVVRSLELINLNLQRIANAFPNQITSRGNIFEEPADDDLVSPT